MLKRKTCSTRFYDVAISMLSMKKEVGRLTKTFQTERIYSKTTFLCSNEEVEGIFESFFILKN